MMAAQKGTIHMVDKAKGKSPYQRYNKVPYQYSSEYRTWRAAITSGRDKEAERLSRIHSAKFMKGTN